MEVNSKLAGKFAQESMQRSKRSIGLQGLMNLLLRLWSLVR